MYPNTYSLLIIDDALGRRDGGTYYEGTRFQPYSLGFIYDICILRENRIVEMHIYLHRNAKLIVHCDHIQRAYLPC